MEFLCDDSSQAYIHAFAELSVSLGSHMVGRMPPPHGSYTYVSLLNISSTSKMKVICPFTLLFKSQGES